MFDMKPDRYGNYSVCVFNAENLSENQIHETFGKFGKISRINKTKNIVFLRYHTAEDAIRCLETMQNHQTFNVKPAKEKKSLPEDNQNLRSPNRNNSETMNQPGYGRRNEDSYKDKSNDGFIKNRDNRDSSRKDGNAALPMPNLVPIYSPKPPVDPNKPKAKVVVVANLPAGFKQHNIYKLCSASMNSNIKPLHVVMKKINRPPAPEVRYAYVYYKTQEEVDVVVEFLNNLPVNGVSLVVKAVDTILQEESNAK